MYGWSNVTVTIDGRRYSGQYEVRGKLLELSSAYGGRTVEMKGRDAKAKAEEVLRDLASKARH